MSRRHHRKPNAYVLACGCRFFDGISSLCDKHDYSERQAKRTLYVIALICGIIAFGITLAMSGCSVDMGGLNDVHFVDASNDVGGIGGQVPTAAGGHPGQMDATPMEANPLPDGSAGGIGTVSPGIGGSAGTGGSVSCPTRNPVNGCQAGELEYPSGPVVCCIPTDWDGYKDKCPPVIEGCRWKDYGGNGFFGVCCV